MLEEEPPLSIENRSKNTNEPISNTNGPYSHINGPISNINGPRS